MLSSDVFKFFNPGSSAQVKTALKIIKTYNVENTTAESVREYSFALGISESKFCQQALEHYIQCKKGMDSSIKEECQKRTELLNAIKGSRSIALKEVGD